MDATQKLTPAAVLINAHDRALTIPQLSRWFPNLTPEEGYAAARALHAHREAQGWKRVGRKIGFTNRTLWERYGVHEPMWGTVYDRTVTHATDNRATVSLEGLVQPRIEPEIAFGLKSTPPVTRDPEALLACIEWIAHSIEIVQCHHADWKVSISDCTADNGLHGKLVVGTKVPVGSIRGLAGALPLLRITLKKGDAIVDTGIGANVLGSPFLALAFLVEILSRQPESPPLQPGEIISTGTITDAHPVAPGETWRTDLHGFACRNLEVTFT